MKYFVYLLVLFLGGCVGSGTVQDSGPSRPIDMSHVPDAVPKHEPRTIAGNKNPYTVLGKTYRLLPSSKGYSEVGGASWYGKKFHGNNTSNGEVYDMYGMTAAHKTLPIPSYVRVTNLENGRQIVVRVNDRGPFHAGRIIDLSYAGASKLGFVQQGTAKVRVETVGPGDQILDGPAQRIATVTDRPKVSGSVVSPSQSRSSVIRSPESYQLPANTYLQAGAFSNRQSAEAIKTKVSLLTEAQVSVLESVGDQLYRVRIGPIRDNRLLLNLRELMSQNQLPIPHIVYD